MDEYLEGILAKGEKMSDNKEQNSELDSKLATVNQNTIQKVINANFTGFLPPIKAMSEGSKPLARKEIPNLEIGDLIFGQTRLGAETPVHILAMRCKAILFVNNGLKGISFDPDSSEWAEIEDYEIKDKDKENKQIGFEFLLYCYDIGQIGVLFLKGDAKRKEHPHFIGNIGKDGILYTKMEETTNFTWWNPSFRPEGVAETKKVDVKIVERFQHPEKDVEFLEDIEVEDERPR